MKANMTICVRPELSIREALKVIDESGHKTCIITDAHDLLLGVLTDGDIRRHILQNGSLDDSVIGIMNSSPFVLEEGFAVSVAKDAMETWLFEAIPVINSKRQVIDVCLWHELFGHHEKPKEKLGAPVVIMAGGQGTRLYPYTKILPKPLIPIGEKPIVEHIMDRFVAYGCHDFHLTVNYKANMIRAYFADLAEPNFRVQFVEENIPLGTGGSLHLLDGVLDRTFFVSNCDVLLDGDYADMLAFHKSKNHRITLVASLKHHTVPYGVIELNSEEQMQSITEKPELTWLVNTGLYLMEPEALADIPRDRFFHITDLVQDYLSKGISVGVYPVSEKAWMDMGQFEEMGDMMKRMGV